MRLSEKLLSYEDKHSRPCFPVIRRLGYFYESPIQSIGISGGNKQPLLFIPYQLGTAIDGGDDAAFAQAHGFHYGVGHALVKEDSTNTSAPSHSAVHPPQNPGNKMLFKLFFKYFYHHKHTYMEKLISVLKTKRLALRQKRFCFILLLYFKTII